MKRHGEALLFGRSGLTPVLQSARTVNRSLPEDRRRSLEKRSTGDKVDASVDFFMRGSILSPLGKKRADQGAQPRRDSRGGAEGVRALGYEATRQMLNRGAFDAEEAARFCTRFTLGSVVPAAKSLTPTSTSLNGKKRRTA